MSTWTPYDLCEWWLARVLDCMEERNRPALDLAYVGAHLPPWDQVCGQLVVWPERTYRSSTFPVEDTTAENPPRGLDQTIVTVVAIDVVRCVPMAAEAATGPGGVAALAEAHRALLDDGAAIWNAVVAPLDPNLEWERGLVRQTPTPPAGGGASIETRVAIGVEAHMWCV